MAVVRAYRSATRDERARVTRARVLAAAASTFVGRGYAATTVREVAGRAQVSVPTVELLFGRKSALLKAAIDVAIAGDDEPVGVLDRPAALAALELRTAGELLDAVVRILGPAQRRSAGLVLAAFEAAPSEPDLQAVVDQLVRQRARTASWIVDRLAALAPLRTGGSHDEAVDTVWALLEPAVFDRLTRHRGWDVDRYQRWVATSLGHLLLEPPPAATGRRPRRSIR